MTIELRYDAIFKKSPESHKTVFIFRNKRQITTSIAGVIAYKKINNDKQIGEK